MKIPEAYRIHARTLREKAREIVDETRRIRQMEEAADIDQLADDIEAAEREKQEAQ